MRAVFSSAAVVRTILRPVRFFSRRNSINSALNGSNSGVNSASAPTYCLSAVRFAVSNRGSLRIPAWTEMSDSTPSMRESERINVPSRSTQSGFPRPGSIAKASGGNCSADEMLSPPFVLQPGRQPIVERSGTPNDYV